MKKMPPAPARPALAPKRRRIFILDDHPVTRFGLTQMLNREQDLIVCGEAEDARQALSVIRAPWPDLIVADVGMPGKSVIEFIKDLHAAHAGVPVLILSTYDEAIYAERLIRAGARGYIMKSEGGASLLTAMRHVLAGQPYLSPAMAARMFDAFGGRAAAAKAAPLGRLTDREFEILQWLGQGKSNREVAEQLCISPKTVEVHRLSLCRKLQLRTPGQLIRYAVQHLESLGSPDSTSAHKLRP
jgi:DNA-binding NarL/FixJ family response regulator